MTPDRLALRPMTAADLPMMGEWLRRPHILEWWGDPEEEIAYMTDMVEGRDPTRPFLILLDGVPAGYIQSWRLGDVFGTKWETLEPWVTKFPPETVGVDITLAEESNLSRGLGSAAIRLFVAMLMAEGHQRIIIDPDPANTRAVRSYQKAGFRVIPELAGKTPGVLLMQFDRSAAISSP
jgi:RimJ/RimL family protein N-acetyltransferase